jgi:hypothetical protein
MQRHDIVIRHILTQKVSLHFAMYLYYNFSADLTECESMSMINPEKNHYLTPIIPIRRASSQGHLASEEAKIAVEAEVCFLADFHTLS